MDKTIAEILPYAIAVALSPMPIAALILMLLSKRARINSVMFTIGWIMGLAILVFAVSFLVGDVNATAAKDGFSLKTILHGTLGVLLILFAVAQWKKRTKKGKVAKMPQWMSAVEKFSPIKAFAIGLLLAVVNLKNTPVGIAVGATLSHLTTGSAAFTGFIAYLILASCTITIPTFGFLLLGKSLQSPLTNLKNWLITNNATIMFGLFLLLGVIELRKAFGG